MSLQNEAASPVAAPVVSSPVAVPVSPSVGLSVSPVSSVAGALLTFEVLVGAVSPPSFESDEQASSTNGTAAMIASAASRCRNIVVYPLVVGVVVRRTARDGPGITRDLAARQRRYGRADSGEPVKAPRSQW